MKQVWKGKQGGKRKKREWMAGIGLIAYLFGLIIRIPLGYIIEDKGIGFLSVGMEVFTVLTVLLTYGISKSVSILIKYRMKREMYKSVKKVFRNSMFVTAGFGAICAGLVFFFAEFIADIFILESMSYVAIAAIAPAIFLASIIGVFRGYFQGMGTMIPTVHSKFLEKFILLAASLIMGTICYNYGLKVADLLKNKEYASAYGALGAALGLFIACILALFHLLFIYFVYSRAFKQQLFRDNTKSVESSGQIISVLITTSLPYTISALLYSMNYLVDQRIYNYAANIQGQSATRILHWGVYYGKYSVVIGIAAMLCTLSVAGTIPRIAQSFERQEYKDAKEKLGRVIHQLAIFTIPCAVIIAVLAEPITGTLFKGELKMAVKMIQAGTAVIILFTFTYFLAGLLQRIRKMNIVILAGAVAFILHIIFVMALINNTNLGILAVVYGNIIFYLITCIICFLGVVKYMQYSQEWFRTFAVTIVAAGISGLIGMLLNKALLSLAGNVVTLIICVFICIIVYNTLIVLLKGVHEDELEEMPGGKIIAAIAVRLRLM